MKKFLKILFDKSDRGRSNIIKKNILGSFFVKGLGIITSLFLVPFTINILNQEKYGIWMTIFSIVSWFNMMDVGIGNGFRNKFAEAIAKDNKELGKEFVQTLYSSMGIIALFFIIIFLLINPFLEWKTLLNLRKNFDENINLIVLLTFCLFCVQLYIKNISTILLSLQKTTISDLLVLLANILTLLFIFVLKLINQANLINIAIIFMICPIIINIFFTIKYFEKELAYYKPKILVLPKKKYLNDLIGLGLKFFLIQLTTIVMFSSANIIISQLFSPSDVTPYSVAFRLYSSVQGIFIIIVTPFWSAFTNANAQNDFFWIKKSIRKLILIWGLFSLGIIILWLISPILFRFWIGEKVKISFNLSLQFAIYVIITSWTSIFVFYVNGVGKVKLQLIIAIIQLILNIPLAIFLSKYFNLGIIGIIMATNLNLLLPAILIPIQYKKLISNNSYGVWQK